MPKRIIPDVTEAINELRQSTGKSAQDKILLAIVDLIGPDDLAPAPSEAATSEPAKDAPEPTKA